MKDQFTICGYNITTDPQFQNERCGNTPELVRQMESLYFETQDKKNKKIIDKLTGLILKYPKSPQLKNYLSVAYSVQKKMDKAFEVNQWILAEHPDYLFAKINLANEYISKGEPEKVPQILGETMEIKALYPERDLFHLAEVTGFYKIAIRYFTAIENLELAETRFEILNEIAPEHPDTESAETFLFKLRVLKSAERMKEENAKKITPVICKSVPPSKKISAPQFNHPQISDLYNFGLRIPSQKLIDIIALPRTTLIQDVEKILEDAVERYDYFSDMDWDEDTHNFVIHALVLLKEINAEESLPNIFLFLEYDNEFLEFWIGDHMTETLWQCFYTLGFNNTNALKQFLLKPCVDTYVKTTVSEALLQMVLHHPEKRNEILNIFTEVLTANLNATTDDNLIDSDFLGLSISDSIDADFYELLPIIKQLYDKEYVSIGINGDYEDVEKEFREPIKINNKLEVFSIVDLYENILNTWAGYKDDMDDEPDYDYKPIEHQQAVSTKIGRNEPCPCGSGKKYKKCCLNK